MLYEQYLFAAGSETSATALEWVMAELIKNPKAMRTGLWPSGKLPVVGGSRRGLEPPHRTLLGFSQFFFRWSLTRLWTTMG